MPKPGAIVRTEKGNAITRNPARVLFAADKIRDLPYTAARQAIMDRWGVHRATAERDIAAAKQLIARELNGMETRAAEARRNERIADKAEQLAEEAAQAKDWAGTANLHRSAIAASREISRLTGAYAPKEVQVSHSGADEPMLQLDAVLGVLSDRGLAALDVVLAELEAAKAAGRLVLPAGDDDDVVEAEIVECETGAGEN